MLVSLPGFAGYGAVADQARKGSPGVLAARPGGAGAGARLTAFRRVDPHKPDLFAPHVEAVAIDELGHTGNFANRDRTLRARPLLEPL